MIQYLKSPLEIVETKFKNVNVFDSSGTNVDDKVVKSFGDEWKEFDSFSDKDLALLEDQYFDILDENIINKNSYCLDAGCGTGRFTKVLYSRAKFFEAADPSDAIFSANQLLKDAHNVRLTKASIENLPFEDNTFDFIMSIGVLHHIPDTTKAMQSCVRKVKKGGYFYVYLYYSLDNRNIFFKSIYWISIPFRLFTSSLPFFLKKHVCFLWAILLYMPIITLGQIMNAVGLNEIAERLPLSSYYDKSFNIINNDALDRFGTKLEHRFSKKQILEMMTACGLEDIKFSDKIPYWHAVGRKK